MKNSISNIISRYNELQPKTGSKITPRVGFYFIQEIFEDAKYVNIPKAKALWKENLSDKFNKGAEVIIQLTSLKETAPEPANFNPEALIDRIVQVTNTYCSELEYRGKVWPIVKCQWIIDNSPVEFSIPSFLDLFDQNTSLIVFCDAENMAIGQDIIEQQEDEYNNLNFNEDNDEQYTGEDENQYDPKF
ncbi:hypothetical protein [Daejeonella oryzae]|uniref:hypothetical protein n=1 Tax=Daejeonella oryzae TaxID=1122943 RepID=UPI0003FE7E30|nr:hypothetical protein [Daejeonella oryzae]